MFIQRGLLQKRARVVPARMRRGKDHGGAADDGPDQLKRWFDGAAPLTAINID